MARNGTCNLAICLRELIAHEAGVDVDEKADRICLGGRVGVLGLPGERSAGSFAEAARHALAAVVCWRDIFEDANGLGIEVLEMIKHPLRLVVEDVVCRGVFSLFLSFLCLLLLAFHLHCCRCLFDMSEAGEAMLAL